MKNICKIILALAICACVALPFAGCDTYQNSENCGGIVKGYKYIGEKGEYNTYVEIELAFNKTADIFYPYIIVIDSFFEDYGCKSVEELFVNDDFIKAYGNTLALEVENSKAIFDIGKTFKYVSVYFYEGVSEYNGLIKIDNLTNYIGYFNYSSKVTEEISPLDKGLKKIYGEIVEINELQVSDGELEYSTINSIYEVSSCDNNFLINVTGLGGYNDGTVTCLVAVVIKDKTISEIKGIAVIGWDENQTFINEITSQFLNSFSENYEQGIHYSPFPDGYLVSGATKTSRAICNAVNGAIEYIQR